MSKGLLVLTCTLAPVKCSLDSGRASGLELYDSVSYGR